MNATVAQPKSLSTAQGILLVTEREITKSLRSKSFWVNIIILMVVALGGIIWMGIANGTPSATAVAVTSESASVFPASDAFEVTEVADRAAAEDLLREGDVDAAVLVDEKSPTGYTVLADKSIPNAVVAALSVSPTQELLDADAPTFGIRYLLGMVFGMVFLMAAMTFGAPISTSVTEEKSTRIIEILISAIPARVLLAGKIIGSTILAMAQIILLVAVAVVGLIVTGQTDFLKGIGAPMVWFAVFFLFGFVLIASMFAAAGALVSRQEDATSTFTPVMIITMLPLYGVIFLGENPMAMSVMSWIPFSSPIAMPVRLFFNEAEWWEPIGALVVMVIACTLIVLAAAKIYENSLLKMGARVKLADALKA